MQQIPVNELVMRHLRTPEEIQAVLPLRGHIDLTAHHGVDPLFDVREKKRDELGITVGFEVRGELMGTIRAVPMRHGLTLAEQLLEQAIDDPGDLLDDSWEMGRLVIGPSYRGEAESLRRCLYLALSFLNDEAPARNLHAACTPTLARLYRRFGFETVAQSVPLKGTDKSYSLIHGSLDRVLGELSDGVEQTDFGALLAARRFSIPAQHGAYL